MRVGAQLAAVMEAGSSAADVSSLLAHVGLREFRRIGRSYPHELSGGMAQRVSVAMAIAANPRLIVADEPTASLDTSIRGQILDLLVSLCAAHGIPDRINPTWRSLRPRFGGVYAHSPPREGENRGEEGPRRPAFSHLWGVHRSEPAICSGLVAFESR